MFIRILQLLVEGIPGARGAVFCDGEGEAVQSFGFSGPNSAASKDDYELKIAGAQLAEPLDIAGAEAAELLGNTLELCIRGKHETLLVHTLPDGYYLLVCLEPHALVALGQVRLREAARRVRQEM